jgi:mRNA interferase MazF
LATTNYLRRDVVDVVLDPRVGSEQKGTRPCLIVQNDVGNQFAPTTIVVPFTDFTNVKKMYPTLVKVDAGEGGLALDSAALCSQIVTIDKTRIKKKRGTVSGPTMEKVDKALKVSLHLS